MKTHKTDWSKMDWSLPTDEIVKLTGVARSTVSYYRRGYHKRRGARQVYNIDWSGADWTKPNVDLAVYYRCTPQAVAFARRHNAPADLKISPSLMTRNKRMRAILDERIARAKAVAQKYASDAKASEPPRLGIWALFLRVLGFNLR